MGVKGLMSTCLQRENECTEAFDLVEVARQENGIELLVDFYSFEHHILSKFWQSMTLLHNNPYLRILGGEYSGIDAYLVKFIEDLKSLGIKLVFYIDGGKGSSTEALRQKLDTWVKRHDDDVKTLGQILEVFKNQRRIEDLPLDVNIRPVVLEDQVMACLKKCECEIFQAPAGEADILIARALQERLKAFAVLSSDSDFCVFKGCRMIPKQLFDLENDLQLGEAREVPEKPLRLMVKVIENEKVMSMLKLNKHYLLVEMSIAAGNDFTGPFMHGRLHHKLDVRGRKSIDNFAGWIRHYKNIENNQVLYEEMRDGAFRNAVYHSRSFYNLDGQPDQPPRKGYFSQLIEEKIREGKYPSNIMSMHNNFYWYRMLLEDNSYDHPTVECALTELRAYVYRMVLPQHEQLVNEYGRSPYESLRKAGIIAIDDGRPVPIHKIQPDKIFNNLRIFHNIMSHKERGNAVNWFDRYGRKNGFIVYILRYFLHLNWQRNLYITENEYLALVAMMFGRSKESKYEDMVLCPTVRCVTIGNWMQDVYRHAYLMLGSLLNLKHEFPVPAELFSGSVWTAMYMVCQDNTFRLAANQVPVQVLYGVQQDMNAVIREKKHIIRHFVEGFFPFND